MLLINNVMDKTIRYSNHAVKRIFERDINEKQIEQTIRFPDYTKTSFEGKKVAVKKFDEKTINVVYIEKETHIKIITIY